MLLGEQIVSYYAILALLIGLCTGAYWITYNNHEFDLTTITNRGNLQGLKQSLKTIAGMIVPVTVGAIIGLNYLGYGYAMAFGLGGLLFILAMFLGIVDTTYTHGGEYSVRSVLRHIKSHKNLMKIVHNFTFMGFALSNPLIEIILPLLLFAYGITEMNLGFLVSFFSVVTIVASYIFGKFVSYRYYKTTYIISGLFYALSVIFLLFFPSYRYVIFFVSVLNLLFGFMNIPQTVFSSNIFHEIPGYEMIKSEYMVIRERPLVIGRILSFVCIYFIGSFDILGIKILFGLMALVILAATYLFNSVKFTHSS